MGLPLGPGRAFYAIGPIRKPSEVTPPLGVSRMPAPGEPPCRRPPFHYKLGRLLPVGLVRTAGPLVRETSMKTRALVSGDIALAAMPCRAFTRPRHQNPMARRRAQWGRRSGLAASPRQGKIRQYSQSCVGRPVRAEAQGCLRVAHENTGLNSGKSEHAQQVVALPVARLQGGRLAEGRFGSRLAG